MRGAQIIDDLPRGRPAHAHRAVRHRQAVRRRERRQTVEDGAPERGEPKIAQLERFVILEVAARDAGRGPPTRALRHRDKYVREQVPCDWQAMRHRRRGAAERPVFVSPRQAAHEPQRPFGGIEPPPGLPSREQPGDGLDDGAVSPPHRAPARGALGGAAPSVLLGSTELLVNCLFDSPAHVVPRSSSWGHNVASTWLPPSATQLTVSCGGRWGGRAARRLSAGGGSSGVSGLPRSTCELKLSPSALSRTDCAPSKSYLREGPRNRGPSRQNLLLGDDRSAIIECRSPSPCVRRIPGRVHLRPSARSRRNSQQRRSHAWLRND